MKGFPNLFDCEIFTEKKKPTNLEIHTPLPYTQFRKYQYKAYCPTLTTRICNLSWNFLQILIPLSLSANYFF